MVLLWQFPLLQTMQQILKFYHILNIQTNHGWEKILKKKSHTCEEGGAHLRISFWHLLVNFEKPEKNQNFKKFYKNCWRYHHFTHVYQKPQLYEVQFLKYEVRHIFLSFWANFYPLTPPQQPRKPKLWKNEKKHLEMSLF